MKQFPTDLIRFQVTWFRYFIFFKIKTNLELKQTQIFENFYNVRSKLVIFLAKKNVTKRKLLYFVTRVNDISTNCAKI